MQPRKENRTLFQTMLAGFCCFIVNPALGWAISFVIALSNYKDKRDEKLEPLAEEIDCEYGPAAFPNPYVTEFNCQDKNPFLPPSAWNLTFTCFGTADSIDQDAVCEKALESIDDLYPWFWVPQLVTVLAVVSIAVCVVAASRTNFCRSPGRDGYQSMV